MRRREIRGLDLRACLTRAELAVHSDVLPLDRQRARIPSAVQRANDLLEVDLAAANAAELPEAIGMTEVEMSAEDAGGLRYAGPPHVFHVRMIDPVAESLDERDVV